MPTFARAAAAALQDFEIRVMVRDVAGVLTVDKLFSVSVLDAAGSPLGRAHGDLTPYLNPQQIAAVEALATALYTKAKAELAP